MNSPDHYRQHAPDCLQMANGVSTPKSKAMLLEMAEAWLKLADQAAESPATGPMHITFCPTESSKTHSGS